jgi:signal transduction histidine kinase
VVQSTIVPPALADAANVLSDQLRVHLRRLAALVKPHAAALEGRFLARLQELGFDPKQRRALAALTPGAAARILSKGQRIAVFLEQVEYNGRRLAKLNLPPSGVVEALAEYDRLLTPLLVRLLPGEHRNFQWVREQLHFCVILTLNKSYYQVREIEARAFYELFRAELEARGLEDLLGACLAVLARFCGAQEAHFFLLNDEQSAWVLKATAGLNGRRKKPKRLEVAAAPGQASRNRQLATPRSIRAGGRSAQCLLDASWLGRFASGWSVPLASGDRVAGVMQFGFAKPYDWLPREQELLLGAAERCLLAAEKARLLEDLAAREEQIRRLAEHMLHIEEVERRRISCELHDEAGQSLLYIRLQLEMLEKECPIDQAEWKARLETLREVTEHAILEARRLIAALSPAVLEQLGLPAALRQLVSRFRQLYPCRVKLQLSQLEHLPKRIETIVYRLVQECCSNIAKQSLASNVNISLASADKILRLYVEDDGIGFPVSRALARRDSFGLAGMRERVMLLGGSFQIESGAPDRGKAAGARKKPGTRITAELPIPQDS